MKTNYECSKCGKPFIGWLSRPRKFCSLNCYHASSELSKRMSELRKSERGKLRKGGRRMDREYVMIYAPDNPMANGKTYVYEHRLVASKMLGRLLGSHEIVHHINGIKSDNRPSNLLVCTREEHMAHHLVERNDNGTIKNVSVE